VGFLFYITHKIHELDGGVLTAAVVNIGKKKCSGNTVKCNIRMEINFSYFYA
jgi:hypothetical protein